MNEHSDVTSESIGAVISRLRREAGFSQEELADRAGIHRTYVSQLERDLKSPTLEKLQSLASALQVRTSVLIAFTEGR